MHGQEPYENGWPGWCNLRPRRWLRRSGGRTCGSGRRQNDRRSRGGRDRDCRRLSRCRRDSGCHSRPTCGRRHCGGGRDRRDGRGQRTHSKRDPPGRGHTSRRRSTRRTRITSAVKLKCPRVLTSLLANPQILLLLFKRAKGSGVKQLPLLLGAPAGFKVGLVPLEAERFLRQGRLLPSSVGEVTLVLQVSGFIFLKLLSLHGASREAELFLAPRRRAVVQLFVAWKKRSYPEQRVQRTSKRRLSGICCGSTGLHRSSRSRGRGRGGNHSRRNRSSRGQSGRGRIFGHSHRRGRLHPARLLNAACRLPQSGGR